MNNDKTTIAERIRAATIADSAQEGVNIADGRFGSAMASLCRELDVQHQGEPVAPIAWHIGGNGYDKVEFTYPSWVGELGNGRPSVSEICTVDDLAELLARIGALRAPHHHPAEQPTPKTFLQERAQLDQEWVGLRELQRLSRQPAPVALTQDAIDRIVPSLSPEPDREEFHCEWALWADREQIRSKLSQLMTANSEPVAVVLPELCASDVDDLAGSFFQEALSFGLSQDVFARLVRTVHKRTLDEVTRLNTK